LLSRTNSDRRQTRNAQPADFITHVVQLMLENRSLDQMLGFFYADNGNRSPLGQPFDGLTGEESDPQQAWLTVAMASTLAGNLTVLGSIANLIVVQRAAASGVVIGLWDYCRVGVPLTLLTLLIGTFWLSI